MSSRSILFTKKTDRILEEMGSQQREYFLDYLHNPLLLQGAAAGTPMRLWASTNNAASWLEVVLDSNAKVDIALWERPSRRSHDMPMDPSNATLALPLSMAGNSRASVDFRRTQETLGSLAYATIGAIRRDDMNLVEAMLGTLAQHIPWVEQITTLAHRVHPSAAVPHFLSSALTQMSLLADIHDPDAVRTMASPGTTAQALLAVHASKHTTPEPGVYALDSPGCPTTYLFVQHRLHSEDPFQARNTAWRIDQEGAHIWLDATGEPVFINAALRLGADALYPSPESQPDSQCPDWIPEGPSLRGVPAPLDNWSDTMAQGFTCGTRALCQQLANATPRALARGECLALVETWAQVQADASARWKDCVSKVHRRQPAFSKYSAAEQCLALWAQYAALVWAEHYPKKHAVLQTLLPKINSFGTMDEWRRQMAAMSAGNVHAARELAVASYPLPIMEDAA